MHKPALQLASLEGVQLQRCCLAAPARDSLLLPSSSAAALLSLQLPSGRHEALLLAAASNKSVGPVAYSQAARAVAVGETGFKPEVFVRYDGQPPQEPALALRGHNFGIAALAWAPHGTLLASTGVEKDRQLILWNPLSGAQLGRSRLDEDYDQMCFLDDKTLCAANGAALTVWTLEKTVSIGRNTQYRLARRRYALDLPPGAFCSEAPPRMLGLCAVEPASRRLLWAALDSGHVLHLRLNGKCERALDLTKSGRLVAAVASPSHIACAMAGGELRAYSTTSLEELAVLACLDAPTSPALSPAIAGCTFSPDGSQLSALFDNGMLCTWDCSSLPQVVKLHTALFHSSPIVDATLIQGEGSLLLASCSLDGKVRLQRLGEGQLAAPAATVDLRQQQELRSMRLCSLAASPDGSLLAAGDTIGNAHLFAIFDTAPKFFRSICVDNLAEISALAFSPLMSAGAQRSSQLLAVGDKSGGLAVLDMSGCAVVAQLQQPQGPAVVAFIWVQQGARLRLIAAARDGCVRAYLANVSAEGQVCLLPVESFQPPALKGSIVSMHSSVHGQAVVLGSKEGRISILDAITGEALASMAGDKSAGDITSMAMDEGISFAILAVGKNLLQLYDRQSGTMLASFKAHLAGTAISRVLVAPGASQVVSLGEDASVRVWTLPPAVVLKSLAELQRLQEATCPASGAASPATTELSALYPKNLFAEKFQDLESTAAGGSQETAAGDLAEEVDSGSSSAGSEVGQKDVCQALLAKQSAQAAPQPPQPPHTGIAGGLAHQFCQLQSQFQSLKQSPHRRPSAEERLAVLDTSCIRDGSAAVKQLSPKQCSSLATYLRSSSRRASAAAPLHSVQAHSGSSMRSNPRASSTHQPWLSPREGSGLWVPLGTEEEAPVAPAEDEIAAMEVQWCRALLGCSDGTEVELPAPAASQLPVEPSDAAVTPASSNREACMPCPESVGSVSSRPKMKRACWAVGPNSSTAAALASRRPLSSLSSPARGGGCENATPPRPSTAMGIEATSSPDCCVIYSDPFIPATSLSFGEEPAGNNGGTQGRTSKRLSFSFDAAAWPNLAGKAAEEGDTPCMPGKGVEAPPGLLAAPRPPVLAAEASSEPEEPGFALPLRSSSEASTPSMTFKPGQPHGPASALKLRSSAPPALLASTACTAARAGSAVSGEAGPAMEALAGQLTVSISNTRRSHPVVPKLHLPTCQSPPPIGGTPPAKFPEGTPPRVQYSARSSEAGELSARLSQQPSQPLAAAACDNAGSGDNSSDSFATAASSSSELISFESSSEDASDSPTAALHYNQLFEGPAAYSAQDARSPGPAGAKAAAARKPAISQLSPGSQAATVGSGSSDRRSDGSVMSAFDRPPTYDPLLETSSGEPAAGGAHASTRRCEQMLPAAQQTMANDIFDTSSLPNSQDTRPFSTFNMGPVTMAKNPAFGLSPIDSLGSTAPRIRRMSNNLQVPAASAGSPVFAVQVAGGSGTGAAEVQAADTGASAVVRGLDTTTCGPVNPGRVVAMFEAAVQALQAVGRADSRLMGQLADLGIAFVAAGSGGLAAESDGMVDGEPSGEAPAAGPAQGGSLSTLRPGRAGGSAADTLKEEILRELRKEIAAGALRL